MGMTMAETILSRAVGRERVKPDDYVTASVDVIEAALANLKKLGIGCR